MIFEELHNICSSSYETILFQAAYTLAFFGLFRVGELVFSSHAENERPLRRDDILIGTIESESVDTMKIRLRKSKTNQSGPPVMIDIHAIGTNVCPVKAMVAFLRIRPNTSSYLLCHQNGFPLTRYQFAAILKMVTRALHLETALYGTHSFRIGAATWLAKRGVSNATIKKMGRWSSNTFERYIRL
ncbi:MAG: tyrosine-type recombinase/integrase [Sedimenticola sp.]